MAVSSNTRVLLAAALLQVRSAPPDREVRLVMGTTAELQVRGLADPGPALDAAFAGLARVDDLMSLFRPSELTHLNELGRARVSPDLKTVLLHALDVAEASDGAFDPTVEPLVRATGGLGGERRSLAAGERASLLARVGYARVRCDEASGEVRLAAGMRLDFGGIAKGYAVDLALGALREAGATSALVDLGSSSLGVFGEELQVDVRDPEAQAAPPWARFRLQDASLSSSGEAERPGHIIDPRTGQPAHRMLGATVVARSGIEADALSTAVYVLGAEAGLRLVERRGAAGFVQQREAGVRVIRTTPGFAAAHALVAAPDVVLRE